tara:strand:- start:512 stop:778 length:267 start_codon:yes stop_codon:yes gene_type:complete
MKIRRTIIKKSDNSIVADNLTRAEMSKFVETYANYNKYPKGSFFEKYDVIIKNKKTTGDILDSFSFYLAIFCGISFAIFFILKDLNLI